MSDVSLVIAAPRHWSNVVSLLLGLLSLSILEAGEIKTAHVAIEPSLRAASGECLTIGIVLATTLIV